MPIFTFPGSPGSVSSASGGKTYGFSNINATPTQIAPANPARVSLTFHNPAPGLSGLNIYVYPQIDGNGNVLAPTAGAPGGALVIYPGGTLTLTGEIQGAYFAVASSGGNPFTVMDSNNG